MLSAAYPKPCPTRPGQPCSSSHEREKRGAGIPEPIGCNRRCGLRHPAGASGGGRGKHLNAGRQGRVIAARPCPLRSPAGARWRRRLLRNACSLRGLARAGQITGAPSDGYGVRRGATGVEAWQQAGICRRGPRGPAGTTGGGCGKHLNVARRAWTVAERPVSYAARRARGTVAGIESGSWRLASSAAGLSAGRQGNRTVDVDGGGTTGRRVW